LKALLSLAREQYLQMHDATLPRVSKRNQTSSSKKSGEGYFHTQQFTLGMQHLWIMVENICFFSDQ